MSDHEVRMARALKQFEEQVSKAAELKDQIAQLKGHARNADGSVTVTVSPSGAVLGLGLSPLALQRSHIQLQQEIMATIRAATQRAAAVMEETVNPLLGDRAAQFQDALNAQAGPPPVTLGPSAPPPANSLPRPAEAGSPPLPEPIRTRRRGSAAVDEDLDGVPSSFLADRPPRTGNQPRPVPVEARDDDDDFFANPLRG